MKLIVALFLIAASTSVYSGSQEMRGDKSFQATVGLGYDYKLYQTSITVSKFLDADNMIGIHAGQGDDGDDHQTTVGIQSKHFLGNSFYIAPELYYLNYFETDDDKDIFDSIDEKITALGLSVRIGNQWQFKGVTLGCDWFGAGRNLVHWKRTDDFLSNPYTFTILNFYVGWSF